jgi:hypothetical protein
VLLRHESIHKSMEDSIDFIAELRGEMLKAIRKVNEECALTKVR